MTPGTDQRDTDFTPATAVAHANIALIKYWGKRDKKLNLPAAGSISLTLDALQTETTVAFNHDLSSDYIELNGRILTENEAGRIIRFLDMLAGPGRAFASVKSMNNFPTAAGLASSASGFAALTLAAVKALNMHASPEELSRLARRGSGSAARSLFGGFVEMRRGNSDNGQQDYAVPLFDENHWDLRMLIAVTSDKQKETGSTEGMERTAATSPFYKSWVESQARDLDEMRAAIKYKDFEKVGTLTEHSCFKMHGLALSANPALLYWNSVSVEIIHAVKELRKQGTPAYITMDAGPQVKILCQPEAVPSIRNTLETIKGIKSILECRPGPAAALKSLEKVYN